jgi:phage terminase large subunit
LINRLEAGKSKYRANVSDFTITAGKVKISCHSLYNPQGKKVVLAGIAGGSNYLYQIVWFEEAHEFEMSDFQSVLEAIRGAQSRLVVYTTNP